MTALNPNEPRCNRYDGSTLLSASLLLVLFFDLVSKTFASPKLYAMALIVAVCGVTTSAFLRVRASKESTGAQRCADHPMNRRTFFWSAVVVVILLALDAVPGLFWTASERLEYIERLLGVSPSAEVGTGP